MLLIEVYLERFVGADIERREVYGEVQDCVVIPLRPNGIKYGKRQTLKLFLGATPVKANAFGQTHFLSVHFVDWADYKNAVDLGYMDNQLKYVGNIRNIYRKKKKE